MNFNAYQAGMPPDDKCHPKAPASRDVSQDYLIIPGGVNAGNEFQDYYCNTDFNPQSNTASGKCFTTNNESNSTLIVIVL